MKFKEIQEKNDGELEGFETKLRTELAELRLQARSGQLAKIARIRSVKRDVARVLTAKRLKIR